MAGSTFTQGKNKILFYTRQVINKSARVILALLYYNTANREVGELSAIHAHNLFHVQKVL